MATLVVYDDNGKGYLGQMYKWVLVAHNDYVREYTWRGYAITLIGDFAGQTDDRLRADTQIAGLEYHDSATGLGAKYFGFTRTVGDYRSAGLDDFRSVDMTGSEKKDWIDLYGSNNHVDARAGNDVVQGGDGRDIIDGGAGNDKIEGGAFGDLLTGGKGADMFVYSRTYDSNAKDSGASWYVSARRDRVRDFEQGEDVLDFRHYRKDPTPFSFKSTAWDYVWRGENELTGEGVAELVYSNTANKHGKAFTIVMGNEDDDTKAEFAIVFDGHIEFKASDFLL